MKASKLSWLNPWQGLGVLPRGAWILFATTLVNRAGSMVLPFLVLYLTQELGLTAGRAGLVLSVYGIGSLVAAPLAGRLCDRLGAPRILKASLFLSGLTLLVFPYVTGSASVVAATLVLAVAAEGFRPAGLALLSTVVEPQHRKAAFALIRLAINLGMSVGPALGGFLSTVSFAWLFWVDGATSILAGIVLLVWPIEARGTDVSAAEAAPSGAASLRSAGALRDGRLLVFLAAAVPIGAIFFQIEGALPLYLVRDLRLSQSFFGLLFTVNTLMIVVLEVRLNLVTAHWSHRRSLVIGALLVGVGVGALAFSTTAEAVIATVVIWTFGEMILLPAMAAYVADLSPSDRRGEYMGLYTMSWGVAFAFGPGLGTVVLERWGADTVWLSALALSLVAAILLGTARAHPST